MRMGTRGKYLPYLPHLPSPRFRRAPRVSYTLTTVHKVKWSRSPYFWNFRPPMFWPFMARIRQPICLMVGILPSLDIRRNAAYSME